MRFTRAYKKLKRTHLFTSINITPLTDIALTLLVVFMVATPMLIQSKIKVSLPQVSTKNVTVPQENLVIFIDKNGQIFIDEQEIKFSALKSFVQNFTKKAGDKSVTLNGDRNVKYDTVVQVLNLLRENKLENIALGIEVKA